MCFAYYIAAYLLRCATAAEGEREIGLSAALPVPSDGAEIPRDLNGLAEAVTQQLRYDAEVAANPDPASYLTPPPIWSPPKACLSTQTDLERP